jgi:hypothetical protein
LQNHGPYEGNNIICIQGACINDDQASRTIDKEIPTYEMPPSLDHTEETQPLGQVSTIKSFFQSCVRLLNDPSSVKTLQNMLERCSIEAKGKIEHKTMKHLHTRRRTNKEFTMNANIGYFNMGDIILDLGSKVNVLPKKTWQCM